MKRIYALSFILVMVIGLTAQSHASMYVRGTDTLGNQLIYDDDFDITWYDYTNAYNTWQNQTDWASGLTVDFGGILYDNWRLPTALNPDATGPCSGYNCIGSEMGHLHYMELGNSTGGPPTNPGNFQNLIFSGYWSGTEYTSDSYFAWDFNFYYGGQFVRDKVYLGGVYALAVRDGDVSTPIPAPVPTPTPEPSTLLLLGGGLAGLAVMRKRLSKKQG